MTKGVALSLCPIVGSLVLWIANEKKEYSYYITNILIQVILYQFSGIWRDNIICCINKRLIFKSFICVQ
jgi:hypothetical protein